MGPNAPAGQPKRQDAAELEPKIPRPRPGLRNFVRAPRCRVSAMTTLLRRLLLLLALLATLGHAAPLAEADRDFLAGYEKVRAALAADDLPAARAAAQALPEAKPVAEATDISSARKAFKQLSRKAVTLARGQPGYFVAHCSMFPGGADWVQTTDQLSNPYWGKNMPRCGEIVR